MKKKLTSLCYLKCVFGCFMTLFKSNANLVPRSHDVTFWKNTKLSLKRCLILHIIICTLFFNFSK